jgi:hypothetical protein
MIVSINFNYYTKLVSIINTKGIKKVPPSVSERNL